jgi:hypothetical protein
VLRAGQFVKLSTLAGTRRGEPTKRILRVPGSLRLCRVGGTSWGGCAGSCGYTLQVGQIKHITAAALSAPKLPFLVYAHTHRHHTPSV